MEQVVWCWSDPYSQDVYGTDEVNRMLEQGWKVKMISTTSVSGKDAMVSALIVLQKEDKG